MARTKKRTVNRKVGIIACLIAVFGTSVFLGREFGIANSPDYDTEASGAIFMISNVDIQDDHEAVKMRLRAGPYLYTYSLDTNKLSRELLPPWYPNRLRSP
jgi:hypothetical protein